MNRNQAHLVKGGRSTSRVLAPPGGSSSICLGGYGGAAEQFSQYGDRRSSIGQQKSLPPQQASRMPARTESRDRDVPGLEGHYQQQRRTGGEDRVDAGYHGSSTRRYLHSNLSSIFSFPVLLFVVTISFYFL